MTQEEYRCRTLFEDEQDIKADHPCSKSPTRQSRHGDGALQGIDLCPAGF